MDILEPPNNINYWIYTLSQSNYKIFNDHDEMYITTRTNTPIKRNDIIMACTRTGFVGILRASKNIKKNKTQTKLFTRNSQYIIKLNYTTKFLPVHFDQIYDDEEYLSQFKKLYSKTMAIKQLTTNCKQTLSQIYSHTFQTKCEMIPILVVPCDKYNLLKQKPDCQIQYFTKHYKKCKNCEKTNNNNIDICSIINETEINIIKVDHSTSQQHLEKFEQLKYAYLNLDDDMIENPSEDSYINVYAINDDSIYDDCLLISWSQ